MTDINRTKRINRARRHARERAKIFGTAECPRISVFKSNTHMYVQAIDDSKGFTIAAVNDAHLKKAGKTKTEHAGTAGKKLAELLQGKNIQRAVFDKGGFRYHGRVKAIAEALREANIAV